MGAGSTTQAGLDDGAGLSLIAGRGRSDADAGALPAVDPNNIASA